jgi:hypothetical protein
VPSSTTRSAASTTRTAKVGNGRPTQTNGSASAVEASVNACEYVAAEQVSDMPHAGRMAVPGSPWGASSSRNRRAVRATIASPPFRMKRIEDRSQRRRAISSARSLTMLNAKFGAHVTVAR